MIASLVAPPTKRLALGFTFLCLTAPGLLANTYYVASSGNDANPGTFSMPFQHIQTAASVMVAGDTCYIRAGTYRETVVPANSGTALAPITFEPYGTEAVTVSGANIVTGWTVYSGGIYEAPFTGSLGDQDQVIVDGQMMNLARWPNTTLDVSRPVKAIASSGTCKTTANADGTYTGTFTDSALTQPAGFFNGAKIHALFGPNWVAQTGTVTNYTPGSVQFKWNYYGSTYYPQAGNPYYLFGLLSLLDIPSEWFIDANAGILYLWPPQNDSPVNHVVEAKQRDYGFDLRGLSYITVQGLSLFACAINTSATSQYLILNNLSCSYLSHYAFNNTNSGFTAHMQDSGIILNGSNNTLINSTLAYSAGNGVSLLGSSNLVENCTIHDVDYLDVDCGAVNTGISPSTSSSNEIAYNTCYNSGRGLFVIRTLQGGYIHNNVLYRSMLETTDGGAIYTFSHDGQNTVIAYNQISDNLCAGNAASGIYLDNNSANFVVHHNLVYNTSWALHYNLSSQNILWYNNTAVAFCNSLSGGATGSQCGTQVINNIFTSATTTYTGAVVSNNLGSGTNPIFAAPASLDFSLQSSSPAIGAGMALPPYTNGCASSAPDMGAFQSGQTPWSAGSPINTGLPDCPTNLTATPAGSNIQLSWTNNSNSENALILERSTDEETFTELTRLPANTTSYTDVTVLPGTYYYRVRADESPNSNYASAAVAGQNAFSTIEAGSVNAESGLTVSPWVVSNCNNGDWAEYANLDFQTGALQISLQLASGASSTNNYIELHIGSITGPLIADINVPGTGSYATYTTLTSAIAPVSGVQNIYFLFKGGAGVCNIEDFSFSPTLPVAAPPAPTGPAAAAISQNQIQVGWAPPGFNESGFKVERSTDNQNFVEIASVSAPASSVNDTGLSVGTTYYYRIRSFNQNGFSSYTATVPATTWTSQQAWRYFYYGTIANTGNAADCATPDGDGLTNLEKYVFGLQPGLTELPPALTILSCNASQTTLSFTANSASGIGYQGGGVRTFDLLSTGNLQSGPWTPVAPYTGIVGDDQTHTCVVPSCGPAQYFRLNVTRQ